MSSGKFSERSAVLTYRQHFARSWCRFVRDHFESPAHAAAFFRVDPSTADNWWEGLNAPQGWVVGRALTDPALRDSAVQILGAAE